MECLALIVFFSYVGGGFAYQHRMGFHAMTTHTRRADSNSEDVKTIVAAQPAVETLPSPLESEGNLTASRLVAGGSNEVNLVRAAMYRLNVDAEPPTAEDFSRLRKIWCGYGVACAGLAAGGLWQGLHGLERAGVLAGLVIIFGSATAIALCGLALYKAMFSFGSMRLTESKLKALTLANDTSPQAKAYLKKVRSQGRDPIRLEVDTLVEVAGIFFSDDEQENAQMLENLRMKARLATLESKLSSVRPTLDAEAAQASLGHTERLNESSREHLASLDLLARQEPSGSVSRDGQAKG